jgi:hypothetical protein
VKKLLQIFANSPGYTEAFPEHQIARQYWLSQHLTFNGYAVAQLSMNDRSIAADAGAAICAVLVVMKGTPEVQAGVDFYPVYTGTKATGV